jgi:HK97 family phage major capsid protein
VFAASGSEFDPEEYKWLIRKGIVMKTQSAYTDTLGGTMVAPPSMGPVIPLIRPQAALIAAGAQTFPLGPQGRHVRPRITGAPSVTAVAESQDALESDLTTDEMVLTAKKIVGLARISEEATLFTSGTIDAVTKAELDRSLGLKMDFYGFYGSGTSSIPAGLTSSTYSAALLNVESSYPSALGIGSNGNALLPQYGDLLPALIEERSFALEASNGSWVMRPGAYASAVARRGDAVVAGDAAGPKVDILRRFDEAGPNTWCGRKVVKTTNIKGDTTKGSGTNLSDVFFGIWSHCIVATYGAIQFNQGMDGNTFKRSQYLVKGTMYGDIGFEHPSAFLWYPYVNGVTDQL